MQLPQRRMQVLLLAVACSAHYVLAQLPPMEPLQPFKPLAPLPPLRPLPGFAPFPAMPQMPPMQMPQMQMPSFPNFPTMQPFQGPAGGPRTYSASSSSSSFAGPRSSTTPGCMVVQETSGESQGSTGSGSTSCSLSQRVEVCHSAAQGSKGHTRAVATINGKQATCCVVLLKLPAKTPQLFCASPTKSVNYSRMPAANTAVELKPTCSSSRPGGTAGSLSCTVTFSQLPEGYTFPDGHTAASPLVLNRGIGSRISAPAPGTGRGFMPCNNSKFKKFMQAVSRTLPDGGVMLTSKCE